MAKEILVLFDKVGNTLDVWFGEPREAEVLIKKDIKTGEIVGFEKFNLLPVKEGKRYQRLNLWLERNSRQSMNAFFFKERVY